MGADGVHERRCVWARARQVRVRVWAGDGLAPPVGGQKNNRVPTERRGASASTFFVGRRTFLFSNGPPRRAPPPRRGQPPHRPPATMPANQPPPPREALFAPYRALGVVSSGVPLAIRRAGVATFATAAVGKAWIVYECGKLKTAVVGPLVSCMAGGRRGRDRARGVCGGADARQSRRRPPPASNAQKTRPLLSSHLPPPRPASSRTPSPPSP